MVKRIFAILAMCAMIQMAATTAFAGACLEWDAPDGEVNGYRIYYGVKSGTYTGNMDVGTSARCLLSDLPLKDSTTYYFTVRAYNDTGESGDSNEISWISGDTTPPLPPQAVSVD